MVVIHMKKILDIFSICLMILVVVISFRGNFRFFFDHMAHDDANLGIALSGFTFSLLLMCIAIVFLLWKRRRLSGLICLIMAPILVAFEVIIYLLQDSPSLLNVVAMFILSLLIFIFGLFQLNQKDEAEIIVLRAR